jgi:hypothetical protein
MTKRIVLSIFVLTVLVSCRKSQSNFPTMDFKEIEYNFGIINEGQKVEKDFIFTNTGKQDLIISGVQGSCGCTVGEYPKKPIKPNEKGVIKVTFNSQGKHGKQLKSVTISANTVNRIEMLKIYVDVKVNNQNKINNNNK